MGIESSAVRSWLAVVRACSLGEAVMAQRLAAIGVRTMEHEVLALLSKPGMTQQALAARCFSAKSHISGLIGQFEERKLVRREVDPAEMAIVEAAMERVSARLEQLFE